MKPIEPRELLAAWPEREKLWHTQLERGRIRLGVEPIEAQVERRRKVTWGGTAVAGGIAAILAALFAAKGATLTGLIVAAALMGPIIATAWIGFARSAARATQYLREKAEVERLRTSRAADSAPGD